MRFEDVLRRLDPMPAAMPDAPAALVPVLTETGNPRARPPWDPASTTSRPAAVLVLLYPDADGEARVILTERADRGGHHSGEVSFPGGSAEPGDADLVATALREAQEEVGLDAAAEGVRVLGSLDMRWIPVSNFAVTPVVAVAARRPTLVAQPDEVAAILEPPVAAFLPDAATIEVERDVRGWRIRYAAYPVDGLGVWGMTAMVLGGLGAHLGALDEAGPLGDLVLARPLQGPAWPELRGPGPRKYQASPMAARARAPSVDSVDRSRRTDDRTPKDTRHDARSQHPAPDRQLPHRAGAGRGRRRAAGTRREALRPGHRAEAAHPAGAPARGDRSPPWSWRRSGAWPRSRRPSRPRRHPAGKAA